MIEELKAEGHPLAVLVSVNLGVSDSDFEASLEELERLLQTAGGECFAKLIQNKDSITGATYIGSGKLKELNDLCKNNDIHMAIFDCELSPMQIRNIENALEDVRVIDRSMLILDIFALHAKSSAGKLQVELAQLKYTMPRLTGRGTELSRLAGGLGTRGPGESQLELDRRHLTRRVHALQERLCRLEEHRRTQREKRDRSGIVKAAIVGYTNAGKSTLLNRLTDAGILAEDQLFATLDPTTRRFVTDSGVELLLTDTVGFIRNLPHHLVKAFKSTLDEIVYADFLILVADASDKECDKKLLVTRSVIEELGAGDKPVILVYNKADCLLNTLGVPFNAAPSEQTVYISAKTGEGCEDLCRMIEKELQKHKCRTVFLFGFSDQAKQSALYRCAEVIETEYTENGARITAIADAKTRGMFEDYIIS